ncbi:unnamed protein product, partial [Heterotrigona itama]
IILPSGFIIYINTLSFSAYKSNAAIFPSKHQPIVSYSRECAVFTDKNEIKRYTSRITTVVGISQCPRVNTRATAMSKDVEGRPAMNSQNVYHSSVREKAVSSNTLVHVH